MLTITLLMRFTCYVLQGINNLKIKTFFFFSGEVIKNNEIKCVMNEGMPMKRDIFEKGRLIIKFKVKFPENDFLPPNKLSQLDKLLPPRKEIIIPDDAEEHDLVEFNPHERRRHQYKQAHDEDEDGMGPHGQRVQCASQ